MATLKIAGVAVLLVVAMLTPGPVLSASAGSCDRACLLGILNNYEVQLLKHDATGIKTTTDFRATENYLPTPLGQGYFRRVVKILDQLQLADPQTGQVAAVGSLDDGGKDAYFTLRLKVERNGRLSQSEMLLIHDGETSFLQKDRSVTINRIYDELVPVAKRSSRDELIRAVENFSDAWQYKDGDLMKFSADCSFSENNVQLSQPGFTTCGHMLEYNGKRGIPGAGNSPEHGAANSPTRPMTPADASIGRPPLQGPWIRDRRYPIVDVERGVVLAYHIQGGSPARPGEKLIYSRSTPFAASSQSRRRNAEENAQALSSGGKAAGSGGAPGAGIGGPPGDGVGGGPPPAAGPPPGAPREPGAAYMSGLFKIISGELVRIDHFEWEGGPNASGGFSDGPAH
jgi:hypothetical protein